MKSVKTGLKDKTRKTIKSPAVRARLRTLLELAIAIGRREGMLGDKGEVNTEGGRNVTDKGNIRDNKASPAG